MSIISAVSDFLGGSGNSFFVTRKIAERMNTLLGACSVIDCYGNGPSPVLEKFSEHYRQTKEEKYDGGIKGFEDIAACIDLACKKTSGWNTIDNAGRMVKSNQEGLDNVVKALDDFRREWSSCPPETREKINREGIKVLDYIIAPQGADAGLCKMHENKGSVLEFVSKQAIVAIKGPWGGRVL